MPAPAHPTAAAPHTALAAPAYPAPYDGPRIAAADFFTLARTGLHHVAHLVALGGRAYVDAVAAVRPDVRPVRGRAGF
ncbi:hypothetical protein ABZ557_31250 [Streptomyces sp. NPDC019645]|uniref:hypothetical protein n=1 Tax=Streptomyces sp. NPDC019645 TaxID=3154786 RepID=UPI0033DD6AE4